MGRRKWILAAVGLPVLIALWWGFRPEKLWITQRVNETAPFDTSDGPQPILTGRFEGKTQETSGRATIFKKPDGEEYLRLSDFTTSNGDDIHVVLARREGDLNGIDFGLLKGERGDQNYDLPAATDLKKYGAVVIYSQRSNAVLGLAKLEQF